MTRRGFTLLELILATAIAAMMALTLYSAMSSGFRARTSSLAQMRNIQSATIALDLVERDLQSILPASGTLSGPMLGYAMGTPGREADSIDFHCIGRDRNSDSPLSEGFRRVQIVLRTDTPTPTLVRRVRTNLLAPVQPDAVEETLATDIVGFSVRYFDGLGWYSEWDSLLQANALPVAIEVTVRVEETRLLGATQPYSVTRLIRLPCAVPAVETEATGVQ